MIFFEAREVVDRVKSAKFLRASDVLPVSRFVAMGCFSESPAMCRIAQLWTIFVHDVIVCPGNQRNKTTGVFFTTLLHLFCTSIRTVVNQKGACSLIYHYLRNWSIALVGTHRKPRHRIMIRDFHNDHLSRRLASFSLLCSTLHLLLTSRNLIHPS